jgi:hypothetical protein
MKTIMTLMLFAILVLFSEKASGEVYCNVDFQDRTSLDNAAPFSFYIEIDFPPGYSQPCTTSNIVAKALIYKHWHTVPEDTSYWNCIGSAIVAGYGHTFAFGHDSGNGNCVTSSDPNAIPRNATSHGCDEAFSFKRADGGQFWPWEVDNPGDQPFNVWMHGTDGKWYVWKNLEGPARWGLTGTPSVYGTEVQVEGGDACWNSGLGPFTVDNLLLRYR